MELGTHEAGAQGHQADPGPGQVLRRALRELHDPRLRRPVRAARHEGGDRRHVDDSAPTPLAHGLGRRRGQTEDRLAVHLEHLQLVGHRHVEEAALVAEARGRRETRLVVGQPAHGPGHVAGAPGEQAIEPGVGDRRPRGDVLAGPVPDDETLLSSALAGVRDSKQMTPLERETFAPRIKEIALTWSVGFASADEIDTQGIVHATRLAALRALSSLSLAPQYLLTDFRLELPELDISQTALVKGDALCLSIAAASVLAKTARDELMCELDLCYRGYELGKHKGYGTQALRMLLRFAFAELNLFRVSAIAAEYNEGAIALLKKFGFVQEVCRRKSLERDGRRWNLFVFGLLSDEWRNSPNGDLRRA